MNAVEVDQSDIELTDRLAESIKSLKAEILDSVNSLFESDGCKTVVRMLNPGLALDPSDMGEELSGSLVALDPIDDLGIEAAFAIFQASVQTTEQQKKKPRRRFFARKTNDKSPEDSSDDSFTDIEESSTFGVLVRGNIFLPLAIFSDGETLSEIEIIKLGTDSVDIEAVGGSRSVELQRDKFLLSSIATVVSPDRKSFKDRATMFAKNAELRRYDPNPLLLSKERNNIDRMLDRATFDFGNIDLVTSCLDLLEAGEQIITDESFGAHWERYQEMLEPLALMALIYEFTGTEPTPQQAEINQRIISAYETMLTIDFYKEQIRFANKQLKNDELLRRADERLQDPRKVLFDRLEGILHTKQRTRSTPKITTEDVVKFHAERITAANDEPITLTDILNVLDGDKKPEDRVTPKNVRDAFVSEEFTSSEALERHERIMSLSASLGRLAGVDGRPLVVGNWEGHLPEDSPQGTLNFQLSLRQSAAGFPTVYHSGYGSKTDSKLSGDPERALEVTPRGVRAGEVMISWLTGDQGREPGILRLLEEFSKRSTEE
ncbi:hypothetical protein KBC31_00510 [Candidatus Saccharibacteria bacterium]|nr:hypothetical protein [Candidatus Saccharibacteria bacterium]